MILTTARVRVGPMSQTFWAIWDRERGELIERTRMTMPLVARGEVWTELANGEHTGSIDWAPPEGGTLVRIEAGGRASGEPVRGFLHAGEGPWVEAICPTAEGDNYVWTRKRVVDVRCDVRIGGRRIRTEARGVEDES